MRASARLCARRALAAVATFIRLVKLGGHQ